MPKGEWHPDTMARPTMVNVQMTTDGRIHHIGVGFDLLSPLGTVVASRGFTWDVPDDHRAALEAALLAMIDDVAATEGLAGAVYPEFDAADVPVRHESPTAASPSPTKGRKSKTPAR